MYVYLWFLFVFGGRDRWICANDAICSHKCPMYQDYLELQSCGLRCKRKRRKERQTLEIPVVQVDGIRECFSRSSLLIYSLEYVYNISSKTTY